MLDITHSLFQDASNFINTFSFIDYHVPASGTHWINESMAACRENTNFRRIFGTYKTMRREWLGDGFFSLAHAIKAMDGNKFANEYLAWVTEP